MRSSATRASPVSYSKRAHTFRTAVGDLPAARARLGSPSFVGLNIHSSVPAGLVAELVAQRDPTRVQDGFCHLGFYELDRTDIANDDQRILTGDPSRHLVQLVAARVGDLGVDRANAAFISGALSDAERSLVCAIVPQCREERTIAACGKRLQSKVNADAAAADTQVVGHIALKDNVPAATSILREAPAFKAIQRNLARLPKPELALEICDFWAIDLNSPWNDRYPAERPLRAAARTETWTPSQCVSTDGEAAAYLVNRVRVQSKQGVAACGEFAEINGSRPLADATGLPPALSLALNLAAIIPDLIARPSMAVEVFPRRGIFDPEFVAKNRHLRNMGIHRSCASREGKGDACGVGVSLFLRRLNHVVVFTDCGTDHRRLLGRLYRWCRRR